MEWHGTWLCPGEYQHAWLCQVEQQRDWLCPEGNTSHSGILPAYLSQEEIHPTARYEMFYGDLGAMGGYEWSCVENQQLKKSVASPPMRTHIRLAQSCCLPKPCLVAIEDSSGWEKSLSRELPCQLPAANPPHARLRMRRASSQMKSRWPATSRQSWWRAGPSRCSRLSIKRAVWWMSYTVCLWTTQGTAYNSTSCWNQYISICYSSLFCSP